MASKNAKKSAKKPRLKKWRVSGWRNSIEVEATDEIDAISKAIKSHEVGKWEWPKAELIK